jgi:2-polyprenyl-3-methyl-5-hydroxy-6-metoxy-1,4-benzoquinol methylase
MNASEYNHKMPLSPIDLNSEVEFEEDILVSDLIKRYKTELDIDISRLFSENQLYISRYRCKNSGFVFFYPNTVVGDGKFYEDLQKFEWYYQTSKWEFRKTVEYLDRLSSESLELLEIGSGTGNFLAYVKGELPKANVLGLELNQKAVEIAKKRSLNVCLEDLSVHSESNSCKYDVVVSFQVLEHIPDPKKFIEDKVNLLKSGGRLIFAVPDNTLRGQSNLFCNNQGLLNCPPHHQGLWNAKSIAYLTKVFPLELEDYFIEPAESKPQMNVYRGFVKKSILNRYGFIFGTLFYAFSLPFIKYTLSSVSEYLPAHSVLAVFRKL